MACGVRYHAGCARAGSPFTSRLDNGEGLILPWQTPFPYYVCELCMVRGHTDDEISPEGRSLVMVERLRQIDCMGGWAASTLKKHGPYLRYLRRFEQRFSVNVLRGPRLTRPPASGAIVLVWAELLCSLRSYQEHGLLVRISFATVRQIRSAASWCYTQEIAHLHPGRVLGDQSRRTLLCPSVSPSDDLSTSLSASGMARWMGTAAKKSWALAHVHIACIDDCLERMFHEAVDTESCHEVACAGTINLLACLGWLRSQECFSILADDLTVTWPHESETRGLPPNIGALEFRLLAATKTERTVTADVVIAFQCASGLSLGKWIQRLLGFEPAMEGALFSTTRTPFWTSEHFCESFAWPILELQRASGEPALKAFSFQPGCRIQDKICSLHSWRRAGRSRVSRAPRHNEPNPPEARQATAQEIYEHVRWQVSSASESMPRRYNQWDLADRIGLTLFCMQVVGMTWHR